MNFINRVFNRQKQNAPGDNSVGAAPENSQRSNTDTVFSRSQSLATASAYADSGDEEPATVATSSSPPPQTKPGACSSPATRQSGPFRLTASSSTLDDIPTDSDCDGTDEGDARGGGTGAGARSHSVSPVWLSSGALRLIMSFSANNFRANTRANQVEPTLHFLNDTSADSYVQPSKWRDFGISTQRSDNAYKSKYPLWCQTHVGPVPHALVFASPHAFSTLLALGDRYFVEYVSELNTADADVPTKHRDKDFLMRFHVQAASEAGALTRDGDSDVYALLHGPKKPFFPVLFHSNIKREPSSGADARLRMWERHRQLRCLTAGRNAPNLQPLERPTYPTGTFAIESPRNTASMTLSEYAQRSLPWLPNDFELSKVFIDFVPCFSEEGARELLRETASPTEAFLTVISHTAAVSQAYHRYRLRTPAMLGVLLRRCRHLPVRLLAHSDLWVLHDAARRLGDANIGTLALLRAPQSREVTNAIDSRTKVNELESFLEYCRQRDDAYLRELVLDMYSAPLEMLLDVAWPQSLRVVEITGVRFPLDDKNETRFMDATWCSEELRRMASVTSARGFSSLLLQLGQSRAGLEPNALYSLLRFVERLCDLPLTTLKMSFERVLFHRHTLKEVVTLLQEYVDWLEQDAGPTPGTRNNAWLQELTFDCVPAEVALLLLFTTGTLFSSLETLYMSTGLDTCFLVTPDDFDILQNIDVYHSIQRACPVLKHLHLGLNDSLAALPSYRRPARARLTRVIDHNPYAPRTITSLSLSHLSSLFVLPRDEATQDGNPEHEPVSRNATEELLTVEHLHVHDCPALHELGTVLNQGLDVIVAEAYAARFSEPYRVTESLVVSRCDELMRFMPLLHGCASSISTLELFYLPALLGQRLFSRRQLLFAATRTAAPLASRARQERMRDTTVLAEVLPNLRVLRVAYCNFSELYCDGHPTLEEVHLCVVPPLIVDEGASDNAPRIPEEAATCSLLKDLHYKQEAAYVQNASARQILRSRGGVMTAVSDDVRTMPLRANLVLSFTGCVRLRCLEFMPPDVGTTRVFEYRRRPLSDDDESGESAGSAAFSAHLSVANTPLELLCGLHNIHFAREFQRFYPLWGVVDMTGCELMLEVDLEHMAFAPGAAGITGLPSATNRLRRLRLRTLDLSVLRLPVGVTGGLTQLSELELQHCDNMSDALFAWLLGGAGDYGKASRPLRSLVLRNVAGRRWTSLQLLSLLGDLRSLTLIGLPRAPKTMTHVELQQYNRGNDAGRGLEGADADDNDGSGEHGASRGSGDAQTRRQPLLPLSRSLEYLHAPGVTFGGIDGCYLLSEATRRKHTYDPKQKWPT